MRSLFGILLISSSMGWAADVSSGSAPTFNKDVVGILQRNCQTCHRPGQIGPMSLLTYSDVRPWAKAVKAAVSSRKMPPWFADPKYGHFANDRTLKASEIETIAKWADAGAPEGDAKDVTPPINWPADGWRIKPDAIVKGSEYHVPKAGILPWVYVTVPTPFKEDTWVTSMEMRPGNNPSLTHHYCVYFTPHKEGTQYGVFSETPQGEGTAGGPFEGCYEKGQEEFDYRTQHAGRLVRANSDMVFQVHYAPNGKEGDDIPQIGFTITKDRPARQYVFFNVGAGNRINIAPNEANYRAPAQEGELLVDGEIIWLQAHAHYRAKDLTFSFRFPDGRNETALRVNWDPYWETIYYPTTPIHAPRGTIFHIEGTYDNSANNRFNPDPSAPVIFGQQAKDEMLFPTFGVLVDGSLNLAATKIIQPPAGAGRDFTVAESSR